jgi:hypothetical protein
VALFIEHIFSYVCNLYRKQEIRREGQQDVNGILRAKNESVLSTVEIFLDCILLGYILKYLFEVHTIHDQPYYFYWILIDS